MKLDAEATIVVSATADKRHDEGYKSLNGVIPPLN